MDFDEIIDRSGTHCNKWDNAQKFYNVPKEGCLPMWVADTDFRAPRNVLDAMQRMIDHGVFGYGGDQQAYEAAIDWWMTHRHGWPVRPEWIFTTTGLVNAIGLCLDTYTAPGDGIVIFPPVYHAFSRVIKAAGREVVNAPLVRQGDRYELDLDAAQAALTGREKMIVFCSPHNPVGRVWTREELESIAEFARRNDLILVSDEIHHDLVFSGHTHIPMARIDGILDRLIMLTAISKTFNTAGMHVGNVIIPDDTLRTAFDKRMKALSLATHTMGMTMVTACYSPEGAAWVDAQVSYLEANRKLFDAGVNAIPGLRSIPLEGTYLAWVDFADTGMEPTEFIARVEQGAGIAANHGDSFGPGGETFLRFNLGTQRVRIEEAVARLQTAFADLQ